MDTDRRHLLCGLSGLVAGTAAAGLVTSVKPAMAAEAPMKRFDQVGGPFGWTPRKLDIKEVQQAAYEGYYYKGFACGYGAFYAIVGVLAEKYGAPYNQFPFAMMEAFKGGIADWGTICGALGGSALAYALFWGRKERNPMVSELYQWYESTALPIYQPADAKVKGDLPQSTSDSVLCHISVSRWCYLNKIEATSKARSERCGRLTADVAGKAAEIFNAKIELGKDWKPTLAKPESVENCIACHKEEGNESNWAKGRMDCVICHDGRDAIKNHYENHP